MSSAFSPPSFDGHSPLSWYRQASQQEGFIGDAAQEIAVEALDNLWEKLIDFKAKRNRFLGRSLRAPVSPQGLYLWGGVGRGKSFLMDMFFSCLPYVRKRRVHFHAFMVEIHARLLKLKHEENPMNTVAAQIAQEVRVLCFDEFHVSDIADAMILGRLLEGLFAHGVVLVATSNYAPDDLYPKGQSRYSFLPTIELIKHKLTVMNVDSGEDYRLRTLKTAPVYFFKDENANESALAHWFVQLAQNQEVIDTPIEILGHQLTVKGRTSDIIWFDFATLCQSARSQRDYLELAQQYRFVLLSGVCAMREEDKSTARRLTWLIDVFYDYRVKWFAGFSAPIAELYPQGDFSEEFTRTASRMNEMQSQHYLALPHLTLDQKA